MKEKLYVNLPIVILWNSDPEEMEQIERLKDLGVDVENKEDVEEIRYAMIDLYEIVTAKATGMHYDGGLVQATKLELSFGSQLILMPKPDFDKLFEGLTKKKIPTFKEVIKPL